MPWAKHPSSNTPERLHLNCSKTRDYQASIIKTEQGYQLHLPSTGYRDTDSIHNFKTLEALNKFLRLLKLEPLPTT